jgi:3-hydroxypropanoate dehydrogenase
MANAELKKILDQTFLEARSFNRFTDKPVSDELLHELYDLMKWGPTAMNTTPGRFLFIKSDEAKAKLLTAVSPGNVDRITSAPVTVVVAMDTRFFDHMPTLFPAYDAKPMFEGNLPMAETTAFRSSSLQGAYLILAARMLGLDAGPMSGFDEGKLNAAFFPDGKWKANFIASLGYGEASKNYPRNPRLPFETAAKIL